MTCEKCGHELKSIGPWPDYADAERVKEKFVCDNCIKTHGRYAHVWKEIES